MSLQSPAQNPNRLLVLDREHPIREFVADTATELGYSVAEASSDARFREEYLRLQPTVILVDPDGLDAAGIEVFSWLAGQRCKSQVLLMGLSEALALSARQELGLAYGLDVSGVLEKPLTSAALQEALDLQLRPSRSIAVEDLRRAIDRAQLCVHYQPKVSITNSAWTVIGMEALLRWNHPDLGLIYPDQFIGLAEQNGLIAGLTDFVLQSGIEQLNRWNKEELNLCLCVNMSSKLVTDEGFPDRMLDYLRAHNISPNQLTIDITEVAALTDPGPTLAILNRLRERQIGLSLDDFGSGQSPLSQLYRLPFSEIKIDRALGTELGHSEKARTIVRGMIDLGHSLSLSVCCEGVESASALAFLQQSGCDSAQGYYIARPMPQEEISRWFAGLTAWKNSGMRRAQ